MIKFCRRSIRAITNKSGIYYIRVNELNYVGSSVSLKGRLLEHFNKLIDGKHENPRMQNTFSKYGNDKIWFSLLEVFDSYDRDNLLSREKYWIDLLSPVLNNKLDPTTERNSLSQSKRVYQFTLKGHYIGSYPSCSEAGRKTGIHTASISACCRGNLKQCGGFLWSYEEKAQLSYSFDRSQWKWRPLIMTNLETGEKIFFRNAADAARHLYRSGDNFSSIAATISALCRGIGRKFRIYTFEYTEGDASLKSCELSGKP